MSGWQAMAEKANRGNLVALNHHHPVIPCNQASQRLLDHEADKSDEGIMSRRFGIVLVMIFGVANGNVLL